MPWRRPTAACDIAQEKVEAVRRWTLIVDRSANEFRGTATQLSAWLQGDLLKALATLDRMSESLETYVSTPPPEVSAAAPPLPPPTDSRGEESPPSDATEAQP